MEPNFARRDRLGRVMSFRRVFTERAGFNQSGKVIDAPAPPFRCRNWKGKRGTSLPLPEGVQRRQTGPISGSRLKRWKSPRLTLVTRSERNRGKPECVSRVIPVFSLDELAQTGLVPGAGIARARRFKAANIKVNATPVISAAFKAGTQTHARSL